MFGDPELDNILQSLSFEVRGETSSPPQPAVLSCGGIIFPRSDSLFEIKRWRQVINLPNGSVSAKIFAKEEPDKRDDLRHFLMKETLN